MAWSFVVTDLTGVRLGAAENATERSFHPRLNGLHEASFTIPLGSQLAQNILAVDGDVLLKVYRDSTLEFVGDLVTAEEVGNGYKRVLSRAELCNQAYVLPETEGDVVAEAHDNTSIAARRKWEEVVSTNVVDGNLRQGVAEVNVAVRKVAKQQISFDSGISNDEPTLQCNFAHPLFRLSKRIWPASKVSESGFTDTNRDQVILQLVGDTNNSPSTLDDTGIRQGTLASLPVITAGPWNFKPVAEAITEIANAGLLPYEIPGSWTVDDNFTRASSSFLGQSPGNAVPTGQTWSTQGFINQAPGNPITFEVASNILHRRAAAVGSTPPDTAGEWGIISGTTTWTNAIVQVDCTTESDPTAPDAGTPEGIIMGVIARFSAGGSFPSTGSWVLAYIAGITSPTGHRVGIKKCINGTVTQVSLRDDYGLQPNVANVLRLHIGADGRFFVWAGAPTPTYPMLQLSGTIAECATGSGSPIEQGSVGIHDHKLTNGECWRTYDNFHAAVPTQAMTPTSIDFELAPTEPTADANGIQIALLNVAQRLGTDKPHAVFEYGTGQPTKPVYGTDYEVGDTVRCHTGGDNMVVRVYGADISIDQSGKVNAVPQLVPDT